MLTTGPSAHLSWKELACRDSDRTPYPGAWLDRALTLASEFEALRERASRILGREASIKVISAYRTPERNASVGGAGKSMHVQGRALDLAPPAGMSLETFAAVVEDQARERGIIRGIGVYSKDGHLHLDLRLDYSLILWRE